MGTLREEAKAFEPKLTKNIAELDKFSVDLALEDREGMDKNGEPFSYKVTIVDGKDYRVPGSVIGGIKALLEKMPDLKEVSVIKQGDGMNTRYQVIPFTG